MNIFYDFHIHSCLSPCGDDDMTPQNIVNMAKIMGYDMIALTDHNTCANCTAVVNAGQKADITVIPGMELCTSEEVHIVCLFPDLHSASEFSDFIYTTLPPVKNKPAVFGEQLLRDENDEIIGTEEKLLITASSVSCTKVHKTVDSFGGVCFPAHIDRSSFGIISNLGTITEDFGFNCAEVFDMNFESQLKQNHPYLNKMKILSNSDAHYLENMRLPQHTLDLTEKSAAAVIDYLKLTNTH